LIAQDIKVDPITMAKVLSKPNAHAWPMYPLKLNLEVLTKQNMGAYNFTSRSKDNQLQMGV
jgi:hypothetical protein